LALGSLIESAKETRIDFDHAGRVLRVHIPLSKFWLFVRDPECRVTLLSEVKRLLA